MILQHFDIEILLSAVLLSSVWANHGDDISIQYSGTPALKGDFVRYLSVLLLSSFTIFSENQNIAFENILRKVLQIINACLYQIFFLYIDLCKCINSSLPGFSAIAVLLLFGCFISKS